MQATHSKNSHSLEHKRSTPNSKLLEIERDFIVPVSQLFEAFMTADAIKGWWWPKGLYTDHVDYDFTEGGKYFMNLKGNELGVGMTGKFEAIIANEHIVMSDHFADKNGRSISAKEAKQTGVWPAVVYITFDFEKVGEDDSKLRLSQQGIPNEGQKDCIEAWNQMFDKLEAYLIDHVH